MSAYAPLDRAIIAAATSRLARHDPDLAAIVARHGAPPLWSRPPGFPTLVHIILEQQVSIASAAATFGKLRAAVGRLTPGEFLRLSDARLRRIGFSRQKTAYCRDLAYAVSSRSLVLGQLVGATPATVREQLIAIKGIGRWTADVYLLMALRHPDIWPIGDLALDVAMSDIKGKRVTRTSDARVRLASKWKPWRSVAARLFWVHYLTTRKGR